MILLLFILNAYSLNDLSILGGQQGCRAVGKQDEYSAKTLLLHP